MTAARNMPALSDDEDGPPNLPPRLRIMPIDNETTETLAPPTDRDAPTQTDNPKPHRDAVNPPPTGSPSPATADSIFSDAVRQIVEAARDIRAEREARRQFEAQQVEVQGQILTCVQRAEKSQEANFKIINDELHKLKASDIRQDGRLAEGDERFERIERSIAELKSELIALVTREMKLAADKIEVLERQLAEAKANDPARPAQAPSAEQA